MKKDQVQNFKNYLKYQITHSKKWAKKYAFSPADEKALLRDAEIFDLVLAAFKFMASA